MSSALALNGQLTTGPAGAENLVPLLTVVAAAISALHFLWLLHERWSNQRVRLDAKLQAVCTPDARTGIRAWIRNTGGQVVNTEWLVFETRLRSWRIAVDARPPLAKGRVESWAVTWNDLVKQGIEPGEPMRARISVDLGREFVSDWTPVLADYEHTRR